MKDHLILKEINTEQIQIIKEATKKACEYYRNVWQPYK